MISFNRIKNRYLKKIKTIFVLKNTIIQAIVYENEKLRFLNTLIILRCLFSVFFLILKSIYYL
ncbi:hypothetical protein CKA32_006231 [Geitlerinema sp. FC II]|nr:hypothetical protein CKA32_006231 [Geitlerinema sp. FC II]